MIKRRFLMGGLSALGVVAAAKLFFAGGSASTAGAATGEVAFAVTKSDEAWRRSLTPEQYRVLREHGTERPWTSPLNDEKRAGIYACAGCGNPLFSSNTKFDSGTGWPSFWAPIEGAIGTAEDRSLFMVRTEVHCARCGGHQGHVFDDGPPPTGLRYCMNGVALDFRPAEAADVEPAGHGRSTTGKTRGVTTTMLGAVAALALAPAVFLGGAHAEERAVATFAGGCFWCVESDFDHLPGVVETVSGYTGGTVEDPTYEQVSAGGTGHREAVRISYDPSRVSYEELLTAFWHSVDPTDPGGQFCDRGESYQTAIFVHDEEQRRVAEASKETAQEALGETIVTPIEDAGTFYPAEDYHQDYYEKNPVRYRVYRWNCGRDDRIEQVWGGRAFEGIPDRN